MPSALSNILWWTSFTVIGIWIQSMIPGVDILIVGLLASLQEENPTQTLWLAVAWLFIQEGVSGLAFGSGILWCAALFGLYAVGRWLFQVRNIFFIALCGAIMGIWHYTLVPMMAALQDYTVARDRLFIESVAQAFLFPPVWFIVYKLRQLRSVDASAL
jgi:hypothetical protein